VLPPLLFLSASLGILLTYIAEGRTSTNSKHISRDPYPLLLCDVTAHAQANGQAGNTCHVTATYCCCVTSLLMRQLPDTWKTQLALPLCACIMFTEMLPGNALIKYTTLYKNNIIKLISHHYSPGAGESKQMRSPVGSGMITELSTSRLPSRLILVLSLCFGPLTDHWALQNTHQLNHCRLPAIWHNEFQSDVAGWVGQLFSRA
jgi:hypothetical protein